MKQITESLKTAVRHIPIVVAVYLFSVLTCCTPTGEPDVVVAMERKESSFIIGFEREYDQHVSMGLYYQLSVGDTVCVTRGGFLNWSARKITKGPCNQ